MESDEVGRALLRFGINSLVRNISVTLRWLESVLQFQVVRELDSDAIAECGGTLFRFYQHATYAENPSLGLLPEAGARGAGVALRVYDIDPDECERRALNTDASIYKVTPTNHMVCASAIFFILTASSGYRRDHFNHD